MIPSALRSSRFARNLVRTRLKTMSQHYEEPRTQEDLDSAPEADGVLSESTHSLSISRDTLGLRGRSGLSTPARIALGESASRLAAPSPVVDPNGLGWPGKLARKLYPI